MWNTFYFLTASQPSQQWTTTHVHNLFCVHNRMMCLTKGRTDDTWANNEHSELISTKAYFNIHNTSGTCPWYADEAPEQHQSFALIQWEYVGIHFFNCENNGDN